MAKPATSRTPVWLAIASTLRSELGDGRYRAGDKLPTEAALADRFGVNRHTVRHAISKLVEEGLVRTRRGAGAFVADTPTDYPIGKRVRFHENLSAAGRKPERRELHREHRGATRGEAEVLEISPGAPVLATHGLSLADGQPIALYENVFPAGRLPDIDAALDLHQSVTKALAEVGVADYTRRSTRIVALRANATQALHLHLAEGDPLLRTTSLSVDQSGVPVEFGRTYFAGDRVTLTVNG